MLFTALNDLRLVLEPVINEERKMHESLKKYQKNDANGTTLSDFDKMIIQYYIVSLLKLSIRLFLIGHQRVKETDQCTVWRKP